MHMPGKDKGEQKRQNWNFVPFYMLCLLTGFR